VLSNDVLMSVGHLDHVLTVHIEFDRAVNSRNVVVR